MHTLIADISLIVACFLLGYPIFHLFAWIYGICEQLVHMVDDKEITNAALEKGMIRVAFAIPTVVGIFLVIKRHIN